MATTPNLVSAIAAGDPAAAFAAVYDTMEVRTSLSPPIVTSTQDLLSTGPQSWLVSFLKPTVVLRGQAGAVTVAPAGAAGDGTFGFLAALAGLVGVGFVLGRWSK